MLVILFPNGNGNTYNTKRYIVFQTTDQIFIRNFLTSACINIKTFSMWSINNKGRYICHSVLSKTKGAVGWGSEGNNLMALVPTFAAYTQIVLLSCVYIIWLVYLKCRCGQIQGP